MPLSEIALVSVATSSLLRNLDEGRQADTVPKIFEVDNAKELSRWVEALEDLLVEDEERCKVYNKKNKRRANVRTQFHKSLKKWIDRLKIDVAKKRDEDKAKKAEGCEGSGACEGSWQEESEKGGL